MDAEQGGIAPDRYARQRILPGIGASGQERIRSARVLVVGLGGLGCPSSLYLAAAGVGVLGLADDDVVDLSNLQRQVLYTEADVGRPKLERAVEALQARNREVRIEPHPQRIVPGTALDIVGCYDLVLDGTDNFATRYLLNDACCFAGVPLLSASLSRFAAQLSLFDTPAGGPCYRCIFPHMPGRGEIPNCAEAGVLGALPGMLGSMQALEAIKWITGVGRPPVGTLWQWDALTLEARSFRYARDPGCPLCGATPSITGLRPENYPDACVAPAASGESIAPGPAAALSDAWFLDVREAEEWALCRLPGAHWIPLGALDARRHELPRDRPLVVYCHHGIRSLHAVRALRQTGWPQAVNLDGGIERWALEVDPTVPRY
jgi:sulfur-carrier protein adenylyltransferase/sulfurtransferase